MKCDEISNFKFTSLPQVHYFKICLHIQCQENLNRGEFLQKNEETFFVG